VQNTPKKSGDASRTPFLVLFCWLRRGNYKRKARSTAQINYKLLMVNYILKPVSSCFRQQKDLTGLFHGAIKISKYKHLFFLCFFLKKYSVAMSMHEFFFINLRKNNLFSKMQF